MSNTVKFSRYSLAKVRRIQSHDGFHRFLFDEAFSLYRRLVGNEALGRVLGICNKPWEAGVFVKYPFSEIVLSGITDQADKVAQQANGDQRVSYQLQNAECLTYDSGSFDLVYCKEGLHHLARPILGIYEMLRVCRKGVIVIEPNETLMGNMLEKFNLTSTYEKNQHGNIKARDNYVFRFKPCYFKSILNSYYLKSDYSLELSLGWLSSRYNCHRKKIVRELVALAGWLASWLPESRGNYMIAIILPGKNIPPDPIPFSCLDKHTAGEFRFKSQLSKTNDQSRSPFHEDSLD